MTLNFDHLNEIDIKGENSEFELEVILTQIQNILDNRFATNSKKQKIKEYLNRLSFSCPYCGDTTSNYKNKVRGNLYLDTLKFKCFNCGKSKNLYSFLRDFQNITDISNSELYKMGAIKPTATNIKRDFNLFEIEDYQDFFIIKFKDFCNQMGFISIENNKKIISYLKQRYINEAIYPNLKYNPTNKTLILPNLINFENEDYIISYAERVFNNANLKYVIHGFSDVINYDDKKWNKADYDDFNLISNLNGLFSIDFNKKIIITEGYFDKTFVPNSISLSGANKKLPIDGDFYFLFDNDETGINQSIEYLKDGRNVFLWKKLLTEYNIKKNIKDINDFIMEINQPNIFYQIDIFKYFSNNKIDLYYV